MRVDWPKLKRQLLERCAGYCEKCALPLSSHWAAHHRQMRSHGGPDELHNLVALHHQCHNLDLDSVHMQPKKSYLSGMLVGMADDPRTTPLRLPDGSLAYLGETYTFLEEFNVGTSAHREASVGSGEATG